MDTNNSVESLSRKIQSLLPEGLAQSGKDFQDELGTIIQSWLARSKLVTREEFEAQVELLKAARVRQEALHQQLAELEEKLQALEAGKASEQP